MRTSRNTRSGCVLSRMEIASLPPAHSATRFTSGSRMSICRRSARPSGSSSTTTARSGFADVFITCAPGFRFSPEPRLPLRSSYRIDARSRKAESGALWYSRFPHGLYRARHSFHAGVARHFEPRGAAYRCCAQPESGFVLAWSGMRCRVEWHFRRSVEESDSARRDPVFPQQYPAPHSIDPEIESVRFRDTTAATPLHGAAESHLYPNYRA